MRSHKRFYQVVSMLCRKLTQIYAVTFSEVTVGVAFKEAFTLVFKCLKLLSVSLRIVLNE